MSHLGYVPPAALRAIRACEMKFDATHKGYGIRFRKSDRLYALIFRPGYTRPLKDIPAADPDEGDSILLERAHQIIERDLRPQG